MYGKDGIIPEEIKERIDYELNIICKKGYDDYILMVADVVEGAHEKWALLLTPEAAPPVQL